jgi:predicted RNA-binding protein with PUA-like domain
MAYWLIKTEPGSYSWDKMKQDITTMWDGVRNYQARNNLKAMKKGDLAFFYHSIKDPAIQGIVQVTKEFYPDPTVTDDKNPWVVVEFTYQIGFKHKVTLKELKTDSTFKDLALVKHSRLSVMPVPKDLWDKIIALSKVE